MNKFLSYQINAVNASIEHLQENREFKLQSPTGSGKTFIISKIIDQFLENDILNSKPTSFIFIAPSTGNLDYQGYEKISSYLKKDWVKGYDTEYIGTVSKNQKNKSYLSNIDYFKENKVYFIGWQMFNKGTRITEINSEKNDIYRVISNTKNNNINIVLIIDEAHREIKQSKSLITERKKVIEDLDPFKIIKVSATLEQVNEEPDYIITYDDVKEEAAIKKNVIISQINQKLININKLDEEEQLIISAIEKQKDIKKMYQKNNIEFNPLIIVQIPDNINIDADIKTEDQLLKKIDSILEKYNYKKSYNYAIWLDKQKTNKKEEIIDNKSPIDILIFKTAIATGWDIPRANILVRIREAKTKAFNIQTLGRILRNPFFKYYGNELIDNAFVFTRDEKYKEYIKQENIVNDEKDLVFAKRSEVAKNSNFTIDKLLFKTKKEYEENKMIDYIVNKISNDDKFKKFFEWQHPNLLDGEIIKDAGDILSGNVDNFKQQNLSQRKIKFNEVRITLFDLYIKYRTVTKSTLLIFKVLEKITVIINKKNKTIKDFYWSC
ncbi:MAG: DEAD/DEAH box helicase family protein, partial [Mycoplasmataceae bacterium]|nr:DEAD/DEAH box helicase family protein [Mycoplasmataceae bacterium]